jgi:hypothetical protein
MNEDTAKMIKARFDALPQSIQEAILSSDYENTIVELGKKYGLTVEQMGTLEQETTLVMMGLTKTKDFEDELISEMHIDQAKSSQITKDINDQIFLRVRDLLKLMNTEEGEEPTLEDDSVKAPEKPVFQPSINSQSVPPAIMAGEEKILASSGIEVVPEGIPAKNIAESKLSDTFTIPKKETEYSLKNLSGDAQKTAPKKDDPYHEPI